MKPTFSICVPTWNSLEYLKILYSSLKRNTKVNYEILIHDNNSQDGTEEWLKEKNISYTKSDTNKGFCGVNEALKRAQGEYCVIMNSDMYALPFWDVSMFKKILNFKANKIFKFTISSCLIEPVGNNPEYSIVDCGTDYQSFDEQKLLTIYNKHQKELYKPDTIQWSHPILIPSYMLKEINYLDESYFPGWNIDNDIPCAFYQKGCRNFVMLGSSRVYHFVSKTFSKLPVEIKNKSGQDTFLKKWGFTTDEFRERMKVASAFKQVEEGVL